MSAATTAFLESSRRGAFSRLKPIIQDAAARACPTSYRSGWERHGSLV